MSPVSLALVPETVVTSVPPRKTSYPATPTASVDAVHLRSTCELETAVADNPVGAVGAVESPEEADVV